MFFRLLFFTLSLSIVFSALIGETDAEKTNRFFPGLISPLPLKIEVPENYEPFPLDPNDGEPNVGLSVFWTDKETYEEIQKLPDTLGSFPKKPSFKVGLSPAIAQCGPNQFTMSDDELRQEIQSMGVKNCKVQDLAWGYFPVKLMSGTYPDGRPFSMALVGLNMDGGHVMSIVFFHSSVSENYESEKQIWNNFITKTEMLEGEELAEALGYNVQPGRTVYTCHGSQLEILGERVAGDKKAAIKITPLTEETSFQLAETDRPYDLYEEEDFFVVRLIMTLKIGQNNTLVNEVSVPVYLEAVDKGTLKGENVFEDKSTVILSGAVGRGLK
jgi:hypothetical protein